MYREQSIEPLMEELKLVVLENEDFWKPRSVNISIIGLSGFRRKNIFFY